MADELAEFSDQFDGDVTAILQRRSPGSSAGSVTVVDTAGPRWHRLAWVSLGEASPRELREAGAELARCVTEPAALLTALEPAQLGEFLTGWLLAGYSFTLKSAPPAPGGDLHVRADRADLANITADAEALFIARDLVNTPSNIKSPEWFAQQVTDLCRGTGLRVSVMDEATLARRKFGGVTAVGSGSAHPPRLVTITKRGAPGGPTVLLVGKGITFDSGGLSLKPPEAMTTMKTDMSGAAGVLGAMLGLARDPGQVEEATVVALLPLAENMPSGAAYRPGDVVTHYGGITSEISNTDAEGRLVLADALAYGVQRYQPEVVLDMATLTGAATLGLSREYAALYASDDELAAGLVAAGEETGDLVWRMPLASDYERFLDSTIADVAQSPTDPQARAGSITAALFLKRFVNGVRWAHLDIAGPARSDKSRGTVTPGGTGFGVRLLTAWLREFSPVR